MNCIIIEKDFSHQQIAIRNCIMIGKKVNLVGVFESAEDAEVFLQTNLKKIDLILLDVILPGKSGIKFISDLCINPYIIITTNNNTFAVKAFELKVVDYIMKPFMYERFVQAVQKVQKLIRLEAEEASNEMLILKNKGVKTSLSLKEIDYIESNNDYVKIHVKNEFFIHLISLKDILQQLPQAKFIQIHRQFIINLDKISIIKQNKIALENYKNLQLPVSRARRKVLYEKILN